MTCSTPLTSGYVSVVIVYTSTYGSEITTATYGYITSVVSSIDGSVSSSVLGKKYLENFPNFFGSPSMFESNVLIFFSLGSIYVSYGWFSRNESSNLLFILGTSSKSSYMIEFSALIVISLGRSNPNNYSIVSLDWSVTMDGAIKFLLVDVMVSFSRLALIFCMYYVYGDWSVGILY